MAKPEKNPLLRLMSVAPRRVTEALVRPIAATGLDPNVLTVLGVVFSAGVAWLLADGRFFWGGWLLLGAGAFDTLDGALARVSGKVSRFGAFLDSTLDRVSEALVFFGLLVFFVEKDALQEIILVFFAMVGSLVVSYIRARAEAQGLECSMGIFTRPVRVVVLAVGLILNQALITLWILAVFSNITALRRIFHVWRQTTVTPEGS